MYYCEIIVPAGQSVLIAVGDLAGPYDRPARLLASLLAFWMDGLPSPSRGNSFLCSCAGTLMHRLADGSDRKVVQRTKWNDTSPSLLLVCPGRPSDVGAPPSASTVHCSLARVALGGVSSEVLAPPRPLCCEGVGRGSSSGGVKGEPAKVPLRWATAESLLFALSWVKVTVPERREEERRSAGQGVEA